MLTKYHVTYRHTVAVLQGIQLPVEVLNFQLVVSVDVLLKVK
jgi:hypothetical protein